jgi:phosphate transport system substrate-binding protein
MRMRSLGWLLAPVLLLLAGAAGAATHPHHTTHHRATHHTASAGPALRVRGDQVSTEGLVDAVSRAFAATGDGHLETTPFNTIDGIDQALSGQVDIAAVARPAYPKRTQEDALTFKPVVWDALVLIANASNPVANLTLKQLHDIYYGKITNWSSVGGPNEPIDLDGIASPLDGVQYSFRQLMFGNGDNPVAVPRLFINIDSLQSEVALDTKALALSTLAHARRQQGIRVIPIEGVAPSLATLQNATYPLPLTIYLAYKADSPRLATIEKFLAFLDGERAGGILRSHDLLPFNEATVLNAKSEADRIDTIGARMVAEGLPPAYAPGNEFARLAKEYPALANGPRVRQVAAEQVATADQQRAAMSQAAGVDPSPKAQAPATAPEAAKTHTVVSGDTLSRIADRNGVSVDDLRAWNHLHGTLLQVGQVLQVSAPRG